MTLANILDPIHDGLSPLVFDDPDSDAPSLKERHHKWIKGSIYQVLDKHGYDGMERWLHLVFTGSLTTYQYSDESDVDISLFVNVEKFPEWSRAEMIGVMVENLDGKVMPGTPHPLQCFVVSSDVAPEDLYKPGLRSGYDLDADEWIIPPERDRVMDVQKEMNAAYIHALQQADKMERLLRYEPDKAVKFWHQIHKRRQRDQKGGKGDYSDSNIAYKMLANRGLFPQISDVSGEYIAKVAWTPGNQNVRKFVYAGGTDQLIVGDMGAPEGVLPSHFQLAQNAGIDFADITAMGTINAEGLVDFLYDKRMTLGDKKQKQFAAQEALKKALPDEVRGFAREQPNIWNFAHTGP